MKISLTKFVKEFSDQTVSLIHQKRAMWKHLQKSGRRVTRSMREQYRTLCRNTKQAIKADRNTMLEKEADELAQAFSVNTFKGYALLKRQHRSRSKAVLPPESDFTAHYSNCISQACQCLSLFYITLYCITINIYR